MVIGSGGTCLDEGYGQVPLGCSAQSGVNITGGDWSAHYKPSGDTGAGCIAASYQLVCSGFGKPTVLIWTEPSSGGKEESQGWSSGTRAEQLFRMFRSGGIPGHSLSTRAGKCPSFPLFRGLFAARGYSRLPPHPSYHRTAPLPGDSVRGHNTESPRRAGGGGVLYQNRPPVSPEHLSLIPSPFWSRTSYLPPPICLHCQCFH